jgi:hypothetical protein
VIEGLLRGRGESRSPGSTLGWHLIEANDLTLVAQHVGEWADVLEFEVYPLIEDERREPPQRNYSEDSPGISPRKRIA